MKYNDYSNKWKLTLLLTGTAVFLSTGLVGCQKKVPVDSTVAEVSSEAVQESAVQPSAQTPDEEAEGFAEEDPNFIVRGNSGTMVESSGSLFFKYENRRGQASLWRVDKKTGREALLHTFKEDESNSLFWYYNGSLYFDTAPAPDSGSGERIGLYQLKLGEKEAVRLMDLSALPTSLYAADGILYVKGYGMELYYALKEDGSLGDELRRENTIYAKAPEGSTDLYRDSLPSLAKRFGYLAVQNNGVLTIADLEGNHERTLDVATTLSDLQFDSEFFFGVQHDGEQSSIVKYSVDSLEPVVLHQTSDSLSLLQYYDGRLYYMVNDMTGEFGKRSSFYSIAVDGSGEPQLVATMNTEPGTTGFYSYYGSFYLADGYIYRQKIKDYGVYIEKTPVADAGKDGELLAVPLYQSGLKELGHVTSEERQIPCECGEKTAAQYYVEKLVIDGDSDAAKNMNRVLEAAAESQVGYGESLADNVGEEWVHDDSFSMSTLQYEISDVTYLDERYFCVEATGSEYMGGAHGMPYREYYIFDRQSGKQLGLSDIVSTPEEELKKIVAGHFREYAERTNATFETPEELEQTVIGRVNYRFPFYLTQDGVVFYFTPYDIAPYAAGFPEVTVPYSELELKIRIGGN